MFVKSYHERSAWQIPFTFATEYTQFAFATCSQRVRAFYESDASQRLGIREIHWRKQLARAPLEFPASYALAMFRGMLSFPLREPAIL